MEHGCMDRVTASESTECLQEKYSIKTERSRMEGEMFGSGHWGSFPYASIPKESQFLFDAKASPLQLQLFGSTAASNDGGTGKVEQLVKCMKDVKQRQMVEFLASLERGVGKKLKEKELEVEAMNRKSKELNEQIRQVALEVQSWQSVALHNQSVANSLKSKLMQMVAHSSNLTREGSGDSEVDNTASSQNVNAAPGGFFQSGLLGITSMTADGGLGACRLCRTKEAAVLVMPCRHLCLCADCEKNADVCPVCRFPKTLMVIMAVANTASGAGDDHDHDYDQFLKLWNGRAGEDAKEDYLNWDDDDDGGDDEDEDEEEAEQEMARAAKCRPPTGRNVVNVDSFGAAGDGCSDDTKAFLNAWKKACSLNNAVFLVPGGRRYMVGAAKFIGPCKKRMIIQIQGTIVAPEEPSEWNPASPRLWLLFSGLAGARIEGGGLIDGSGSKWWANSCKIDRSKNAQQMHLTVSRSRDVRLAGVRVDSPEDSPNTDGIHVADSTAVTIQSCRIATGDDCISISNGSFAIRMKDIDCGPGHGISIGSLGQGGTFAAVDGVYLDGARIRRAQNGVRIKTWQGGAGYVRNVRFAGVRVDGVDHPIVIDQFYCDSRNPCRNQTSNVRVSGVMYRNITGTARRAEAIRLACSDAVPCVDIVLSDINLRREDGAEVQTVCNCAMGIDEGRVHPAADCLRTSPCGGMSPDDYHPDDKDDGGDEGDKSMALVETKGARRWRGCGGDRATSLLQAVSA
uniref:RING-type domain-containing protein n=1 Tax=Oryza punctata TaxID=4537 RepID=A0A0E0JV42_ORYPU